VAEEAPTPASDVPERANGETAELLGLIDRLEALLSGSDLDEIEVEAGETALILRRPSALLPPPVVAVTTAPPAEPAARADAAPEEERHHAVVAPLTGLYYGAPSPGAEPYLRVGGHVSTGQVIGLIEAMKLFNEIKSDVSGRVVRIVAENGKLVKAKQPLIEVDPS
jgi:acetyl-CoA carboxylase biotin carboxyl carrier protein